MKNQEDKKNAKKTKEEKVQKKRRKLFKSKYVHMIDATKAEA